MSVWVLHLGLTPQEEEHIEECLSLVLPFPELPDLSPIHSDHEFYRLMQLMHPHMPPESITGLVENNWPFLGNVQPEDVLAIPLQAHQEVALAEVTGRYQFTINAQHQHVHSLAVKWYGKRIPFKRFGKHRPLFLPPATRRAYEITQQEVRTIIRDKLPHAYNRFAKFKWLLVLFFGWRAVLYVMQMMSHNEIGR